MRTTQDVMRPPVDDPSQGVRRRVAVMGDAVSTAAEGAAAAAGEAMSRLPAVASGARSALIEANRQIRTGSDEILIVGGAFSLGFAMGLLFGGANRLLVAGALLPAATMGLTILERSESRLAGAKPAPGRLRPPGPCGQRYAPPVGGAYRNACTDQPSDGRR